MSSKVVIKPETAVEPQENAKNIRRGFKVLQKTSTSKDKENLVGRKPFGGLHKAFVKSKSANELNDGEIKRKKLVAHSVQTGDVQLSHIAEDCDSVDAAAVAADDPSTEHYWKHQAEKHRVALEAHLRCNERLHNQVCTLKDQLDETNRLLADSKSLVEVLTELLQESEVGAETEQTDGVADAAALDDDVPMAGPELNRESAA